MTFNDKSNSIRTESVMAIRGLLWAQMGVWSLTGFN